MMKFLSVFSLDFLALECLDLPLYIHPYYLQVYLWCILPIVVAIIIVMRAASKILSTDYCSIVWTQWRGGGRIASEEDSSHSSSVSVRRNETISLVKSIVSQHSWLLLFLSYIVLPVVSNKQLQIFDCIELESDKTYLRVDTSIDCRSEEYYSFRTAVSAFIVVYQLIPIIWMVLLYQNIEALTPQSMKFDETLALFTRDNNPDLDYIRFLFIDYKCSKWWFEVVDLYRRIVFIGILPLVSPEPATRASFGLLLGFLSHIGFSHHEPYRYHFTNTIASIAQVLHVCLFQILFFYICLLAQHNCFFTFHKHEHMYRYPYM